MDKRLVILFIICMFLAILLISIYRSNFMTQEAENVSIVLNNIFMNTLS